MSKYNLSPLIAVAFFCLESTASDLPAGYWGEAEADAILEKTLRIDLGPSLGHLSAAENAALPHLLDAGRELHDLYLRQIHHQALAARSELERLRREVPEQSLPVKLLELFRLAQGPVITTLTNERVPFVPAVPELPGRNVYPLDLTTDGLESYLTRNAGQRGDMLAERTVVRRATLASIAGYLGVLDDFPILDVLHPGLRANLQRGVGTARQAVFLAIPYAVEYADEIMAIYADLNAAAGELAATDPDFAAYLRNRARDLLSDDYESGDASWVTGRFGNLNAQIGSYETYDDKLYGVKTFFSMSLLARDEEKSRQLAGAIGSIQEIEDRLPYEPRKRVRSNIPVGVYNVIADFGQSRGGNTATILPNDASYARKYGRTILLRYNIMTHPGTFADTLLRFAAATDQAVHEDLTSEARFHRTLFHEIGHYLGVDRTSDGRSLEIALGKYSDLLEEMKSDLVSLHAIPTLVASDFYSADLAHSVYAAGISRTLQVVEPRRQQPYQTMQLMQFNYFLEHGVLGVDDASGGLTIDYARYHTTVEKLLREILTLQAAGDVARVAAFVDRWAYWRDVPHATLAQRMRASIQHRYTLFTYAAETGSMSAD